MQFEILRRMTWKKRSLVSCTRDENSCVSLIDSSLVVGEHTHVSSWCVINVSLGCHFTEGSCCIFVLQWYKSVRSLDCWNWWKGEKKRTISSCPIPRSSAAILRPGPLTQWVTKQIQIWDEREGQCVNVGKRKSRLCRHDRVCILLWINFSVQKRRQTWTNVCEYGQPEGECGAWRWSQLREKIDCRQLDVKG